MDRFARYVSAAGALLLLFLAGMAFTGDKLGPYPLLKRAEQGWIAFREQHVERD